MTGRPLKLLFVAGVLLAGLFAAAPAASAQDLGKTTVVPLPRELRPEAAGLVDLDGDGNEDLIVAAARRGRAFERSLRIHLFRAGETACFGGEPDAVLNLTPDVVAFTAAQVADGTGAEILLFSAAGAFAWPALSGEEARPRKLVACDFLWQLPHPREVFFWRDGVADVNRDGLPDLLLPEPEGYRVALQSRQGGTGVFDRIFLARLPARRGVEPGSAESDRRAREESMKAIRDSLVAGNGNEQAEARSLAVWDAIPRPVLADWNADRLPDILAQSADELLVWLQSPDGGFAEEPALRLLLPLEVDRGRRLDISFGTHAGDLDADGRADCVILAGSRRSEDAAAQVLVYVQAAAREGEVAAGGGGEAPPLFGPRGVPSQLLVVGGFVEQSQIVDVDGGGLPDLVLSVVDVDAVDTMRAASTGALEVRVSIYLNRQGRFSARPDAVATVGLSLEDLDEEGEDVGVQLIGDATGNGLRDLLVRSAPDRLRVIPLVRSRDGIAAAGRPAFELPIDSRGHVNVHERAGGAAPQIVVLEHGQVVHVRFR